jgi:hypothetical protein
VSRAPVAAFVALVIATVAAFFVVQHLKVTTPLINGFPAPVPSTINPVSGSVCPVRNGKGVSLRTSFRRMKVSFYLLNRADDVDVYMVDRDRVIVDTLPGSGRRMGIKRRRAFFWDGRLDDGRIAPDGVYYIRVSLVHQGRYLLISSPSGVNDPVTVDTVVPRPVVTGVSPATISAASPTSVTIRYSGTHGLRPRILIYRIGPGGPRQVKSYAATSRGGTSVWDGTIGGRPAPAGTYVVGVALTNQACTTGRSADTVAAAPHAVVTVS